ncbi:MAG: WbqC family protein [Brumimicrobium sp.]
MIFSTNYFGTIPYFQALAQFEEVTIDMHEFYKKQTWRNRTQILGSNGPMYLSVPVLRPEGSKSTVRDIKIANETNWRKDHWKAIESSYKHAPYYFYYGPLIKNLIYQDIENLVKFNDSILRTILNWLDLKVEINFSKEYIPPLSTKDYRVALDQKTYTTKQRKYIQVFSDKLPFSPNLSIIDLLFNEGPLTRNFIVPKDRNLFTKSN